MRTLAGRAPWGNLAELHRLLSPVPARSLLVDAGIDVTAVDPGYLRLKPETGALVGLTIEGRGSQGEHVRLPAYVRTTTGERAAALAAKWGRAKGPTPLGPAVRLLPGGQSVLFLFPADARLRELSWVMKMPKLKRRLGGLDALGPPGFVVSGRRSSLELLRYKPERRIVARANLRLSGSDGWRLRRAVILRYFSDKRGVALAGAADRVRSSSLGPLVPKPLGTLFEGRLFFEEEVSGVELATAVLNGGAEAEPVAQALARLHESCLSFGPARPPGALLVSAARGLHNIALLAPGLRPQVDEVVARLSERNHAATTVPVHGDLHLHQVVVTGAGPVLVDLERVADDDPLLDLGGLVAHLRVLALRHQLGAILRPFEEELVETYLRLARPAVDGDLGFAVSCGLLQQALLAARCVEREWPRLAEAALELADSALDEFPPGRL
ncbi:MAG: aminoglycoside phosphotransferase family protein [Actinobacteria bacterium]|nr:aminoglycoside phosphotransferase family protein [Actinomycetota bacterium]